MSKWQDAEQHADNALDFFERGRWSDAESELRKALDIDPDQGDWHFNLGLTLERCDRDAEALSSYEHASRLLPDAVGPQLAAGSTCLRLERCTDAISWFEDVLAIDQKCEPAWAMLIDARTSAKEYDLAETTFYMAQDALPEPSANVLVSICESLLIREQWDRAAWCAREAMKIDQNVLGARIRLASALIAKGESRQASQLLLRELRQDPGNVQALLLHADLLVDSGQNQEALMKLHRILELEPANVQAHIRAGAIAMEDQRWEEAFIAWGLVRRLDPSHPMASLYLAKTLLAMGRTEAARPLLQERLDRMREDEPLEKKLEMATLLLQAGEPAMAVPLLSELTKKQSDPKQLRLLAVALFASDQRDEGAAVSRKVLRIQPDCIASIHNLALWAFASQQYRLSWGWVRKGLEIDPHDEELRRLRSRLIWKSIKSFLKRVLIRK
ncbi:MAG: tetratricopeptide repeat protein [Phycisphaerales bacterium]|jgi:tetratricopeptide (TPR) repeat protein|nr:tetratricopeptide repeat protein [Phycisphaerales bacterium]